MTSSLVERATRNNALWCDAVCEAHGRPGTFAEGLWLTRSGAPRFYPDAITLAGPTAVPQQIAALAALLETRRGVGVAVKDSFSSLDLVPLGFEVLIEAQWLHLPPPPTPTYPLGPGVNSTDICDAEDLAAWEQAWRGNGAVDQAEKPAFPPSLLSNPEILFIAITQDGRTVGGGILNGGSGVVGISNVFVRDIEPGVVWRTLAARCFAAFPGLALVGYERGPALEVAIESGFRTIGPLRVWLRAPTR